MSSSRMPAAFIASFISRRTISSSIGWGVSASGSNRIGSPGPGSLPNFATNALHCSWNTSLSSGLIGATRDTSPRFVTYLMPFWAQHTLYFLA